VVVSVIEIILAVWLGVVIACCVVGGGIFVAGAIFDAIRDRQIRTDEILRGLREPTWKIETPTDRSPTPTRKEARG